MNKCPHCRKKLFLFGLLRPGRNYICKSCGESSNLSVSQTLIFSLVAAPFIYLFPAIGWLWMAPRSMFRASIIFRCIAQFDSALWKTHPSAETKYDLTRRCSQPLSASLLGLRTCNRQLITSRLWSPVRGGWLDVRSIKYMSQINVLFVCGRNQKRSPTAQKLYQSDQRLSVRSAGTSDSSKRKIQYSDLSWADLILVMEPKYEARIRSKYPQIDSFPKIQSIDIPDDFEFMSEDLIEILIPAVEHAIDAYQTEQGAAVNP